MNQLTAIKQLNALKLYAINNGGYEKHKTVILLACEFHKKTFEIDLTPKQWLKSKQCSEVLQLMDKDFSYCKALETVLKSNPTTNKEQLENELNNYI